MFRNSILILVSLVIQAGIGFIFWVVAARSYGIEEIGIASALVASASLIIILTRLGLDSSIIRFFPDGDKRTIFGTALLVTTASSIVVSFAFVAYADRVTPGILTCGDWVMVMVFVAFVIGLSVWSIIGNAFIASRNSWAYLINTAMTSLRIPLLILFVLWNSLGILAAFGVSILFSVLVSLPMLRTVGILPRFMVDISFLRRAFRFSAANYAASALFSAPALLMPIIVAGALGTRATAIYYIAYSISCLLLLIPNAAGTSLFVEGSHSELRRKNVVHALALIYILLAPMILILIVTAGNILGFFGSEYREGVAVFRYLVLSSLFSSISIIFFAIARVRRDLALLVQTGILSFVLPVILSIVLLDRYGLIGIGYGWLAGNCMAGLILIVTRRGYL